MVIDMRKENASFQTKFISEAGSYLHNADYFAFVELKDYACYVAADGIDSDERKESAKLAVTTVITQFSETPGMSGGKLKKYMRAAHEALLAEAGEIRLETSIVILVTDYKKVRWAHAGNSRLYWMRNGAIKASTKDTSLTQRMVDQEELALDQLAYHEERNNLYCYLGQPGRFTPVISKKKLLEDGDILLLETRGVWENVGEAELLDATDGMSKPEEVCMGLEDVILSQRLNVIENYTIAAVFVNKVYRNPKAGRNKRIITICVSIGMALLLLVSGILIARYNQNRNNLKAMEKAKQKGIEYLQESEYESAAEQFEKAYDTSEKIKVREKSKNGKKIQCVEAYDKMLEYVMNGLNAMDKNDYKNAHSNFQSASKIAAEIKDLYEEENQEYVYEMDAYVQYSCAILDGNNYMSLEKYSDAVSRYEKAARLMEEQGTVEHIQAALDKINAAKGALEVQEGENFFKNAKKLYEEEKWLGAKEDFETAKKHFAAAKDEFGVEAATERADAADDFIASCDNNFQKQDKTEIMKQAAELEQKGDDLLRDKKYKEAQECFEQAQEQYMNIEDMDSVRALTEKVNEAKGGPDAGAAFDTFIAGVRCMAGGDFGGALNYMNSAKAAYTELKDDEMVGIINDLIGRLQR